MINKFELQRLVQAATFLSAAQTILLLNLTIYADKDGWCFPSHKKLAEDCRTSDGAVRRVIRQLEEKGILNVVHCQSQHKPNRYRIVESSLRPIIGPHQQVSDRSGGSSRPIPEIDDQIINIDRNEDQRDLTDRYKVYDLNPDRPDMEDPVWMGKEAWESSGLSVDQAMHQHLISRDLIPDTEEYD